ncbi:hypothetical protein ON010_g14337 [Phytophthora cinnamomi]|nr:hypothetical protein ON010_g14337 [Phytophthora cinnamomi]
MQVDGCVRLPSKLLGVADAWRARRGVVGDWGARLQPVGARRARLHVIGTRGSRRGLAGAVFILKMPDLPPLVTPSVPSESAPEVEFPLGAAGTATFFSSSASSSAS